MSLIQSPCKDCPDRRVLCHSECEKYIKYRSKLDEINAALLEESEITSWQIQQVKRSVKRRKR